MRLDADARFTAAQVCAAFDGAHELEVEAWQAMFGAADLAVLRLFEGVRGVRSACVGGSVAPVYGRWLEAAMMSAVGDVLPVCPLDGVGDYDIWTNGNR